MSTTKEDIYIHNVYIEPTTHSTKDISPILLSLKRLLGHREKHIILGDFNLHYPLWNSPLYDKYHYLVDELLNIVGDIDAILHISKDLATRDY